MITINTTSWHYKFLSMLGVHIPHALCPYVRKLFVAILGTLAVTLFAAFLLACSAWTWIVAFGTPEFDPLALVGCLTQGVAFIVGMGILWDNYKYDVYAKINEWRDLDGPVETREPNVFALWWKAKHDKLCPLITFKE